MAHKMGIAGPASINPVHKPRACSQAGFSLSVEIQSGPVIRGGARVVLSKHEQGRIASRMIYEREGYYAPAGVMSSLANPEDRSEAAVSAMGDPIAIRTENLTRYYHLGTAVIRAVDGISLQVHA